MRAAAKYVFALAVLGIAHAPGASAQTPVFEERFGYVKASCQRVPQTRELVCVIVYMKQPYLGVQLGSKGDPESVAITAGVRRAPGSEIVIRVDNHAVHSTPRDGFFDYEAESMLTEMEYGEQITVRVQSTDSDVRTADTIPLADFNAAIRAVREFRESAGEEKGI